MITLDKTGASVDELIRQFRKENNVQDWELKYDVISKSSSGFFGIFGKREAKVRFYLPESADRVRDFVEQLMIKMGIGYSKVTSRTEGKTVYVEIVDCKDPGFLIGKNGSMLETIQFLVNRIFEGDRKLDKVYLDSEGYRERREAAFLRQYTTLIKGVEKDGKPLTLEPMNSGDRRVIHRYIERARGLKTLTVGEGEKKRVVIFSAKLSDREALAQSKLKPAPAKAEEAVSEPKEPAKREPVKREPRAPREQVKREPRPPREQVKREAEPVVIKADHHRERGPLAPLKEARPPRLTPEPGKRPQQRRAPHKKTESSES